MTYYNISRNINTESKYLISSSLDRSIIQMGLSYSSNFTSDSYSDVIITFNGIYDKSNNVWSSAVVIPGKNINNFLNIAPKNSEEYYLIDFPKDEFNPTSANGLAYKLNFNGKNSNNIIFSKNENLPSVYLNNEYFNTSNNLYMVNSSVLTSSQSNVTLVQKNSFIFHNDFNGGETIISGGVVGRFNDDEYDDVLINFSVEEYGYGNLSAIILGNSERNSLYKLSEVLNDKDSFVYPFFFQYGYRNHKFMTLDLDGNGISEIVYQSYILNGNGKVPCLKIFDPSQSESGFNDITNSNYTIFTTYSVFSQCTSPVARVPFQYFFSPIFVGDINNDGKDDFGLFYRKCSSSSYKTYPSIKVFLGQKFETKIFDLNNPIPFSVIDFDKDSPTDYYFNSTSFSYIGDINKDGIDDFAFRSNFYQEIPDPRDPLQTRKLDVNVGRVSIILGKNGAETQDDFEGCTLLGNYTITSDNDIRYTYLGNPSTYTMFESTSSMSKLGDVNGDGVDDFGILYYHDQYYSPKTPYNTDSNLMTFLGTENFNCEMYS